MSVDCPLTYKDAMIVILTAFFVAILIRSRYLKAFGPMIRKIDRAADGDLDIRMEMRRPDAVGEMAEVVDRLLASRASTIY